MPTPHTPPPVPVPLGPSRGQIADLQAAHDIITYNQAAGSQFGRLPGVVIRWELPVPVYVDSTVSRSTVEGALEYWRSVTGLTYAFKGAEEPLILVRPGTDGLADGPGRGGVALVYPDNRARIGEVVVRPDLCECQLTDYVCALVFRHELGHAIGIFGHIPGVGIMAGNSTEASRREINLLVELYRLPYGTHVESDGSWSVQP